MAGMNNGKLTHVEIAKVCALTSISIQNMENIAVTYLGTQQTLIDSLKQTHQHNPSAFNRDILVKWSCTNAGPQQRVRLAAILYEAADAQFCDPDKVFEALGVSRDQTIGFL